MNEKPTGEDDPKSQESQGRASGQTARPVGPEAMCPMASMCSAVHEGTPSRFLLMLPGAVLILVGVAILFQPQVLVWLVAAGAVILGSAMMMMANFVYRFGTKGSGSGS